MRVLFRGGLRDADVVLAAVDAVGLGVEECLMSSSCKMSGILVSTSIFLAPDIPIRYFQICFYSPEMCVLGKEVCGVRGCVCNVGIRQRVYGGESKVDVKCVKECLTSSKSNGKSFVERWIVRR